MKYEIIKAMKDFKSQDIVSLGGNSYDYFKVETAEFILKHFNKTKTILDIGPGSGIYSVIFKDVLGFENIDCVEIFEPHVEYYSYKTRYRNIYISDILNFEFDFYNIIIMGDILEHLSIEESQKLIKNIKNKCEMLIIQIPYTYKQGEHYGNKYEIHKQEDLTNENFLERYPDMKLLKKNASTGVYFYKNKNLI